MRYLLSILLLGITAWGVWRTGLLDPTVWMDLISWQTLLPCFVFLVLSYIAYVLRGLRWAFMTRGNLAQDARAMTLAYGVAFAIGAFTPARSGDLARIEFTQRLGYPYGEVSGAYMAERLADFAMLISLFLLGIFWTKLGVDLDLTWSFSIAVAAIFLISLLFLLMTKQRVLVGWIENSKRLKPLVGAITKGALTWNKPGIRSVAFGLTLSIWALHVTATTGFLLLVSPSMPLTIGLLFLTITNLSGLLQLTPGNLGPYEIAGTLVLTTAGVPTTEALAITVSLHIFSLAILLGYGLVCAWQQAVLSRARPGLE